MKVLGILDGAVQSQGIKVSARDWLDIGSETWPTTPNNVKAAAYQAVVTLGWQEAGLLKVIKECWGERIDEDMAQFTIDLLKDLAKQYPLAVVEEYKDGSKPPVWKIQGCDKTLPFPTD